MPRRKGGFQKSDGQSVKTRLRLSAIQTELSNRSATPIAAKRDSPLGNYAGEFLATPTPAARRAGNLVRDHRPRA
jgi:hypothetical protein